MISYDKGSRSYPLLTPTSRHAVKSYARGNKKAAVANCFKCPVSRGFLVKHMQSLIHKELRYLCSDRLNSVLRTSKIEEFSWDGLLDELRKHAPLYFAIMQGCTRTRTARKNQDSVIGMCTAILLKHKFNKMCAAQKMISLILYAGHAGKQVCS